MAHNKSNIIHKICSNNNKIIPNKMIILQIKIF